MRRVWVGLAMAIGLASITAGGVVISNGGGSPDTANIWVDTDGGTCVDNASPVTYSSATACSTLDAANDTCEGGDTVRVKGGTYPSQDIVGANGRSGTYCTFYPETGQTVVFNCDNSTNEDGTTIDGFTCVDVDSSWIAFDGGSGQDFETETASFNGKSYQGRWDTERNGTNHIYRNMNIGAITLASPNITVESSDLGPSIDPLNIRLAEGDGHILQDNFIHSMTIESANGHMECITWDQGLNIIIRRNTFDSCDVMAIFNKPTINTSGTVENNVFYNSEGLSTTDYVSNVGSGGTSCVTLFRYNTSTSGVLEGCSGLTAYGNIFRNAQGAQGTFTFNLTSFGDSNFVNPSGGNFHLNDGTTAEQAGNPAACPSDDRDGTSRPIPGATTCDAGAYERN